MTPRRKTKRSASPTKLKKYKKDIIFIPAKKHSAYVNGEGTLKDLRPRRKPKAKSKKKGSLNGPPGTFKLTDRQLCKLKPGHVKAIIESHRKKGDRIIGLGRKPNCSQVKKKSK